MQEGPTPISTSTAGLPLSQASIKSRTRTQSDAKSIRVYNEISDTLETSDRESDGRQLVQNPTTPKKAKHDNREETSGSRLDLMG